MRKVLRVSLLSLFAMAFSSLAFAEGQDVSNKIWNGDAEKGLQGWEVTFATDNNVDGRIWKISNHTEGISPGSMGYWGFTNHCLEIWAGQTDGVGNPVGKNSITQVVTDLPNGTYVFGAFTIATIQSHGTSENKTKYIPTKDDVEGVYMFANDVKEGLVAVFNAIVISALVFAYNYFFGSQPMLVTGSVSISLALVILVASLFGTFVPMTFEKLKIDPAIATGPFISVTNDIIGMLIYMGVTLMLLG